MPGDEQHHRQAPLDPGGLDAASDADLAALAEIEAALGLPAGAGVAACVAEIQRLQAEEATLIAHLNAEIASTLTELRQKRVREIMLDALREAQDTLGS